MVGSINSNRTEKIIISGFLLLNFNGEFIELTFSLFLFERYFENVNFFLNITIKYGVNFNNLFYFCTLN